MMTFRRKFVALSGSLAALGLAAGSATAQPAKCNDATTLGVERIVEIDTKDGPRLGNLQYKQINFLEPGEVVLTFDDGPSRQTTPAVLEALAAHCTRATFFMVGRMAVAEPELVRRVASLGHTVGSHTWSHQNLGHLSADRAEREVELGVSAITAALGKPIAPFFRFPYLSDPGRVINHLEGRNHGVFSIDVDSYDWRARSRSVMHNNVLSQLEKQGKGIILFHDIQKVTSSSLGALLDELKRRKFKVVHLVPKATAVTVAAYDDIAGKELARRAVASAERPLSNRAMVWPIAGGEPAATVTKPKGQAALPWNPQSATEKSAPNRTAEAPQPAKAPAAVEAPPPRPGIRRPEPSWQEQLLFQNR